MSSCWKCGRELPEGLVECDTPCSGLLAAQSLPDMIAAGKVVLNFEMRPDASKLATPGGKMMFDRALREWMMEIARAFRRTGLNTFCKPISPEDGDE